MTIKFKIDGSLKNPKAITAVREAEDVWNDIKFREFIKNIARFEFSNIANVQNSFVSGVLILKAIEKFEALDEPILVMGYHTWRGVYGFVKPSAPKIIHLNDKFFGRSVPSIRGTVGHESVHVFDNHSPETFGHGSNSPNGKQFAAPNFIGSVMSMWLVQGPGSYAMSEISEGRCGVC